MSYPEWIMNNGDDLQVSLFFALLVLLAAGEMLLPRRPGNLDDRWTRWKANLALTFVNFVALGFIPLSLISAAAWAKTHGWGLLNLIDLPLALTIVVTLLLRGFISFFTHYLFHKIPLFWRVHRIHHLDTELDVTTTVRFHPLEFWIGLLPGVPLVLFLGLDPWILMTYELLDVIVTLWTHSNVRIPLPFESFLRYVVVTPDLHRVHHSTRMEETDSNYGAVFPFWDLVFGTFKAAPVSGQDRLRIGLDEVRGRDAHRPVWLLRSIFDPQL